MPGVPLVSQIGVQSVQSGDPLPCNWAARIVGAFGNAPNIYDTLAQKGSGLPCNWTAGTSVATCHGHTISCGLCQNRLNKNTPKLRSFCFSDPIDFDLLRDTLATHKNKCRPGCGSKCRPGTTKSPQDYPNRSRGELHGVGTLPS